MKIAICDDDKEDILRLRKLLERYDEVNHIGLSISEYEAGIKLLDSIRDGDMPDIIFLDINMERMDGLTLAGEIRKLLPDVPIVLVTAYINYAIEGYKVRASRFLVKDDLEKTIDECMDDVCRQVNSRRRNMLFTCVEGDINIALAEIIFVETAGHKSIIHTSDKDYHIYESMEALEKRLGGYGFIRVHKSYMANVRHIREINNYMLVLDTGYEIMIPKARYRQVKTDYAISIGRNL